MPAADSLENYTDVQREQLARTALALFNNPEVAKDAKRLVKKIDPKANFPDVDVEDQFASYKAEQAEKDKKRDEEDRVRRANDEYQRTCSKITSRGYKVEDVEKLMKDKGIFNHETAMEFLDQERRLAPPTPDSLYTMEMPKNATDIWKDKKYGARQAHQAIEEIKRARQAS